MARAQSSRPPRWCRRWPACGWASGSVGACRSSSSGWPCCGRSCSPGCILSPAGCCDRLGTMLKGKRILLIVAGGIAAFKSLELIRRLRERGASVACVLTEAGAKFVTPLSLQALTEDRVYSDMFSLTHESEMGHIQLSRDADLLVVAPATANILARMAAGMADDLAATVLLATDKPVLVAPAMNVRMWLHEATQANVETLKKRGVAFVGPNDGAMACNEYGPGR